MELAEVILNSRRGLANASHPWCGDDSPTRYRSHEAEGGCGVIGLACSRPISGKHLIVPCGQMCNRGNGKGGGVAVVGCFPEHPDHYAIHLGYLDGTARKEIEERYLFPHFHVDGMEEQPVRADYREWPRLEIEPPQVVRYFARVKESVLGQFAARHGFEDMAVAEEEFVFQNSFQLNSEYYGDREDKKGFVLSHGRNMMILKAVGYAEDIAEYYCLEDMDAYVWIGHQRYPTRGRVWHPGGAHPFSGLDEALVHNGDFANYYGVVEYLKQRNYFPLFMTDTEVSVYLFDLYSRVYGYPLEYVIEALAPTTERDFAKLPQEKRQVYRAIQRAHLHGSPDGPWFFIVARNDVKTRSMQLIGITDTSMLRPQVFALQEGEMSIGVIASEKQAIDALLADMVRDYPAICPVADSYWNARGGSHSDGGAFVYSVGPFDGEQPPRTHDMPLRCADKFGQVVALRKDQAHQDPEAIAGGAGGRPELQRPPNRIAPSLSASVGVRGSPLDALDLLTRGNGQAGISQWSFAELDGFLAELRTLAGSEPRSRAWVVSLLTLLHDRRYDTGSKRRSALVARLRGTLDAVFRTVPQVGSDAPAGDRLVGWRDRGAIPVAPLGFDGKESDLPPTLFIDCTGFEPQGDDSAARLLVRAYQQGWRRFVVFGCRGDRFLGCGLGSGSHGVRIDVYGSSGDYLGSGLDGAEVHVHGDAQDQVGQIMKSGKLVIHGMVGQTLLYGAKGGVVYVMGNAAGRPLINAVGCIRTIINGTALDYAAESFMAGPTTGGGFLVINGIGFQDNGGMVPLVDRYPGGNFFSLASGGAGYINDPNRTLSGDQLNGGELVAFGARDWSVIEPHLWENEEHFGIRVCDLLGGRSPGTVYRKVIPERRGADRQIDSHT